MDAIPVVMARTHPPEYRLHKYWSRKPHNVLGNFIDRLLDGPGTVVDPFCGSGVLLREAALRGHRALGFDLNPAAALIARVTCKPPDPAALQAAVEPALAALERRCRRAWGAELRYAVHQVVVECPGCGRPVAAGEAAGRGRGRRCPDCGDRLRFNLAHLVNTRITALAELGRRGLQGDAGLCAEQQRRSDRRWHRAAALDVALAENRRILAFAGLRVADLFTPRNAGLLAATARDLERIADPTLRDGARLLLTGAAAQCSRLIPFRNNLSTGGPAWSVPGFWVPPVHLETQPAIHLRARLRKLCAGLERLHRRPAAAAVEVRRVDARRALADWAAAGGRADLVFLDPPYGDSVPYLEFSALWNALLGESAALEADLSVSDRRCGRDPWRAYRRGLEATVAAARRALAPAGKLLITFNNHDRRAWQALLGALQAERFVCDQVVYQLPAVVPAKACFAPRSSYVGDLYAVYRRAPAGWRPSRDLQPVAAALRRAASARGGRLAPNLARRTAAVAWMRAGLDAELLDEREALLDSLFMRESPECLRFQGTLDATVEPLESLVRGAAAARLCQGPADWPDLVAAVAQATEAVGLPEAAEIKAILADRVDLARLRPAAAG
jgi:16S rRNA G966 N2-methylase RsmD/DNA-directed RNA polymerase subunit RPC12/RpoP